MSPRSLGSSGEPRVSRGKRCQRLLVSVCLKARAGEAGAFGNQIYNQAPNPFYGLINPPGFPPSQPDDFRERSPPAAPRYNGVMSFRMPGAHSTYRGAAVRLEKRFSKGLTFMAAFTGGKTMDNSAAAVTQPASGTFINQNQYDGRLQWAVSPQDISRSLAISFIDELPFGKGKKFLNDAPKGINVLLSGWQVNGILTFQHGTPNRTGRGDSSNRNLRPQSNTR